jgi:chromosome segregation ATPase
VDKQLFQREQESKNLESYQKEKVAAETSLQHLEKSQQEQENQINSLNDKIQEIQAEKEKSNSESLQQQQRDIKQIFQNILQIEQLVEDSVSNQNLMKKLQEDEKKLSRLYSILSKEIVLFALDDYLPILSDIINDYLAQCVDYSIQMHIVENNEKLELEAKTFD